MSLPADTLAGAAEVTAETDELPEGDVAETGTQYAPALEFIELNPGCTKREALDAAGVHYHPFGGAPDSVDRLFRRGLVCNGGRRNRYAFPG
jgi:hypothetical protein